MYPAILPVMDPLRDGSKLSKTVKSDARADRQKEFERYYTNCSKLHRTLSQTTHLQLDNLQKSYSLIET